MRIMLFCLVTVAFFSCRKECNTIIRPGVIDSATAVWFMDSVTNDFIFKSADDTSFSQPLTINASRTGWQYPEGGTDCKDLFMTSYELTGFTIGSNKFTHSTEQNSLNGPRVKIDFNGNTLAFFPNKITDSYQYNVSDTETVWCSYQRYDSVQISTHWYKPVYWINAVVPAEPVGINVQLFVTPHRGVIKYVQDTLTMELVR
ncbi:MAG: hypothetical protein K1X81_03380 [Bacteroidia bacterium]|nr:hypothetical protein [Bacteroidia bacterium]